MRRYYLFLTLQNNNFKRIIKTLKIINKNQRYFSMSLKDIYSDYCLSDIFKDKNYNKNTEDIIKKIFTNHEKESSLVNLENENIKFDRSFHSVSVYLLGRYLLKNKFYSGLDIFNDFCRDFNFESLNNPDNDKQINDGINYIWSLTSLYHDVVSSTENSNKVLQYAHYEDNPFITPETFINISKIFGKEKIIYTIFDENPKIDKITKSIKNIPFEKELYSQNQIESYFRYRLNDGNADHGIISGYIFYDSLVKNYLEKLKEHLHNNSSTKITAEFISDKNLKYRPTHLVLFKIIANAIICHNIWRYEPETRLKYFDFGICDEKFEANKKLLTKEENPLLFFLCLTDTIEPVKFFQQIDAKKVLAGIEINANENKITLTINKNFDVNSETVKKWFEKIESMKKWMKIDVKRAKDEKSIEISFSKEKYPRKFVGETE